jgi:hypothetical protein
VAEDKVAILMLKMLIELHAMPYLAQHRGERRLARLDRVPAQIDAVEFEQVEGENTLASARRYRRRSNAGSPLSPQATPSSRNERTLSAEAASKICGYRSDQLWLFRVSSRTPAGSRRTIMRKPSCLIS